MTYAAAESHDRAGAKRRLRVAFAAQVTASLVGVYLMFAPALLGYDGTRAADVNRAIGPLIATVALCAAAEVLKAVRWANLPLAGALVLLALSPRPVTTPWPALVSDLASAAVVIGLTLVPYPTVTRFGGGWSSLWRRG